MIKTTKYSGIDSFIIANAISFTNTINTNLKLKNRENEDLFQELVICGCIHQNKYKQGVVSEQTYVYRAMKNCFLDMFRKYNRDCRKIFLTQEQEIEINDLSNTDTATQKKSFSHDIIDIAHVNDILSHLSKLQQEITLFLMSEIPLLKIASTLGISIGTLRSEKKKIQIILKDIYSKQHNSGNRSRS